MGVRIYNIIGIKILIFFRLCFPSICVAQSQPCEPGWFGDECQFQCHCAANTACDPSGGACSGGCDQQWFGPACQYDVSQFTTSNGLWLTDNNDGTCNNDGNAESVTVALVTPHPLTWVRVMVSDSTYISDFQLSYQTSVSTPSEQCTEARYAKVDDNTLDIFCPTSVVVSHVTLSGAAVPGLCTLYISGGRNVALKQATEQSSRFRPYGDAKKAVDGTPSGPAINFETSLTCSHTSGSNMAPKPGWWRVTFSKDVEIYRFIIYNRKDCCENRLVNFTIQAYSSSGANPVYTYIDPGGLAQPVYTVVPSPLIQGHVERVRFDVSQNTKGSSIMTLCEVYAFGEVVCPPRKFGRQCERDCNCADQTEACFVSTGGCPSGCAAGYIGEDCNTPCARGTYGEACNKSCSDHCEGETNSCNHVNGTCDQGCDSGYLMPLCTEKCPKTKFGEDCTESCNTTCMNRECDHRTGVCDRSCADGYIGDFCEQECPFATYGPGCNQNCSMNCLNQTCHHISGKCIECIDTWTGDFCDTGVATECRRRA